jgi:5-amino-6-(5-phospho-D-ribitylamino)uracil phosphatase
VVVAGGSILACPRSGRTIRRAAIEAELVGAAVAKVVARGYPAMVLKDPVHSRYDYLVVVGEQGHEVDPVSRWWFEKMSLRVEYARCVSEDAHPEHTVRLGVCGRGEDLARLRAELAEALADKAYMHHFPAVVSLEDDGAKIGGQGVPGAVHGAAAAQYGDVHILEIFAADATKWSGIRWIADEQGVEPSRIAAIGDEINDLSMISSAGLGIAMANAVPAVREAASRRTLSNEEDGVAHAIYRILEGRW